MARLRGDVEIARPPAKALPPLPWHDPPLIRARPSRDPTLVVLADETRAPVGECGLPTISDIN
jgi:hypothetical protein